MRQFYKSFWLICAFFIFLETLNADEFSTLSFTTFYNLRSDNIDEYPYEFLIYRVDDPNNPIAVIAPNRFFRLPISGSPLEIYVKTFHYLKGVNLVPTILVSDHILVNTELSGKSIFISHDQFNIFKPIRTVVKDNLKVDTLVQNVIETNEKGEDLLTSGFRPGFSVISRWIYFDFDSNLNKIANQSLELYPIDRRELYNKYSMQAERAYNFAITPGVASMLQGDVLFGFPVLLLSIASLGTFITYGFIVSAESTASLFRSDDNPELHRNQTYVMAAAGLTYVGLIALGVFRSINFTIDYNKRLNMSLHIDL